MNGWAESAMNEAIDVLAKARRNDLSSDLIRIMHAVNFDDLEIMRNVGAEQVADALLEAESTVALTRALRQLVGVLNVSHCTIHVVKESVPGSFSTRVLTTYSSEWISRYIERRYFHIDPIIRESKLRVNPFYWDEITQDNPIVNSFWKDAASFGVGSSGYSLPMITENGDSLALSISSIKDAEKFREDFLYHESDIFNIGVFMGEAFTKIVSTQRPVSFQLTDDQLAVLQAISNGVEESELEKTNFLFGSYSTLRRSICSLFRTKTIAQAAVLSARIGILDNLPINRSDVLMAGDEIAHDGASTMNPTSILKLVRARTAHSSSPGDDMRNIA